MSQECGFFNAQLNGEEYDRVYLAEQFAAYFASFIGNGVFGKSMQQLEVVCQNTPSMSIQGICLLRKRDLCRRSCLSVFAKVVAK